jgi:hypothetical protein
MLESLFGDIQAKIQQQIQERFGLNTDQTSQSTNVLFENFQKFISQDIFSGGIDGMKDMMNNGINDITNNPKLNEMKENLLNDLVNKVGLSEEMAQKVRDFSIPQVFAEFRNQFLDDRGMPDFSKILSKVNMADFQTQAQELLSKMGGNFGNMFGKQ